MMFKIKFQILFIILIGLITGCAGQLKIVPTIPETLSPDMVKENSIKDIEEQFRHNEPRYSISLPQNVVLYKSFYCAEKSRLYLWLFENNEYEMMAIDLANFKTIWSFKLPKGTKVHGIGTTAAEDIYLDLNYNGSALLFMDQDQGIEKWRHGKGAKEEETGYCKYFSRKFNFLVTADSIIIQDPATYQTLNKIERFTIDRDRNGGQGYKRFYNIHVYKINNQFVVVDNGLHAISMETGKKLWSSRFPTVASRYHTGKNVGKAILGAFVGVYGGGRGPDHFFSSPLIVHSNGSYFVSALSNLYRINASTGFIEWAHDLDIGFANRIDTSEDRIYLASCGRYESGIYSFEQANGGQVPLFKTPFTRPIETEILTSENLEKLTENKMWKRNLACYNARIDKKNIIPNDKYLYYPVILTKNQIMALSFNAIDVFDKKDGSTKRRLPNPIFGCNKIERIMPFGENQFLAISKNEITAINTKDFTLAWKFDAGWTIDNINKFIIKSVSDDYWYIYAIIDGKIKGYILKKDTGEMIMKVNADQSLRGTNFLAFSINNKISIFK